MLRVLSYLVLIILIGSGFAWLANNPVDIILPIADRRIVISLLLAVSALLVFLLLLVLVWWLVHFIVSSPFALNDKLKEKRKNRGEDALIQGLFAALSGDGANALHLSAKADKLLGTNKQPLQQLLCARAQLLNNDREGAVKLYEEMRKSPKTKLVALRGLYQEAIKSGAHEAANQYAEEAATLVPSLDWANRAVLDKYAVDSEWDKALSLFNRMEKALPRGQRSTDTQKHLHAVLLIGEAINYAEDKPDEARSTALQAIKLDPDFVPATIHAANILFQLHEIRKGEKIIEALWRHEPHPDLARIYLNAGSGERAVDRLKSAKKLASFHPDHFESLMIVARAALEAGELPLARDNAQKAMAQARRESVFLLLADIEEAQSGDLGRVRQWLAYAVNAERDPAWVADGVIFDQWAPVSPISGRLDAFEWKTPMRHLSPALEEGDIVITESLAAPAPSTVEAEVMDVVSIENDDAVDEVLKTEGTLTDNSVAEKQQSDEEKTISEPVEKTTPEPNDFSSVSQKQEDDASSASEAMVSETPFFDGELIEENQTPPPLRLNVDDPGIEEDEPKKK